MVKVKDRIIVIAIPCPPRFAGVVATGWVVDR